MGNLSIPATIEIREKTDQVSSMFEFKNKKILILSPQPWQHLLISKHHYSQTLARDNDVYYFCAPDEQMGFGYKISVVEGSPRLKLISYKIPLPGKFKFHARELYKSVNLYRMKRILRRMAIQFDVCIDFGSLQLYDDMKFVDADLKIFFPVDDSENLKGDARGADIVFSVSKNIVEKFDKEGIPCHFINHGLSKEFALAAKEKLAAGAKWKQGEKIRVGYAGNLFIAFLNIPLFKKLIETNKEVLFELYGSIQHDETNQRHNEWVEFLKSAPNVELKGFLPPKELVKSLGETAILLLCYQPDFKNYHGENSHKIFEYLSTGNILVSTHISLYAHSPLLIMTKAGHDEELPSVLHDAIAKISQYNSTDLRMRRMELALDNTYELQIKRIEDWINRLNLSN